MRSRLCGHDDGPWEDKKDRTGLSDGSADGNLWQPGGYLGPTWGSGPEWHDYTADGAAVSYGPHSKRGSRGVEDLGFYLDTNGKGVYGIPHVGTTYSDTAPGVTLFLAAKGSAGGKPAQNLVAKTTGVDAMFGGNSFAALAGFLRAEVDSDRTAIAHFSHWNILPNGPAAGPGTGAETDEAAFDPEEYVFGAPQPSGPNGEEWNEATGEGGLGHGVLVVGYTLDMGGLVTHLIVHDNWPATGRNVKVPVGSELVAITTVVGYSLECDALIAGSTGVFDVTAGGALSATYLYYGTDGLGATVVPPLGVMLDVASAVQAAGPVMTSGDGRCTLSVVLPASFSGKTVWWQAARVGFTTNVLETAIP